MQESSEPLTRARASLAATESPLDSGRNRERILDRETQKKEGRRHRPFPNVPHRRENSKWIGDAPG